MTDGFGQHARPYGLLAQFDGPERLVEAARAAHAAGYRRFDGFSPFPIEEMHPLMSGGPSRYLLPLLTLAGAITLGGGGYLAQYWMLVVDYPINVGGRPLHSWPSFLPSTIILSLLGAATTVTLWMLALNRLPTLYHPVFNDPQFARVNEDGFFLCIESADPRFDPERTRRFIEDLRPNRLAEVRW